MTSGARSSSDTVFWWDSASTVPRNFTTPTASRKKASRPDKVFAAAQMLHRHGVPFNTLTVVNRVNAKRPPDVYRFLKNEVRPRQMQFIPCVEPKVFHTSHRRCGTPIHCRRLIHRARILETPIRSSPTGRSIPMTGDTSSARSGMTGTVAI